MLQPAQDALSCDVCCLSLLRFLCGMCSYGALPLPPDTTASSLTHLKSWFLTSSPVSRTCKVTMVVATNTAGSGATWLASFTTPLAVITAKIVVAARLLLSTPSAKRMCTRAGPTFLNPPSRPMHPTQTQQMHRALAAACGGIGQGRLTAATLSQCPAFRT